MYDVKLFKTKQLFQTKLTSHHLPTQIIHIKETRSESAKLFDPSNVRNTYGKGRVT
jgi:hypothetical protein